MITMTPDTSLPAVITAPLGADLIPLSWWQEYIWRLHQHTSPVVCNIPVAFFLPRCSTALVETAVSQIIERHEVLRSVCTTVNGDCYQVVQPHAQLWLPYEHMSGSLAENRHQLQKMVRYLCAPFDLRIQWPCRFLLLQFDDATVLLAVFHYICVDGWSINNFAHELACACAGEPLPEIPVQYGDYAHWQRQQPAWDIERSLPFTSYLFRSSQAAPSNGAVHHFSLGEARPLRDVARDLGVTQAAVVFAAYQWWLHLLADKPSVTIGYHTTNRLPETENLIGMFVNFMRLRTSFEGNPSFRQIAQNTHEQIVTGYDDMIPLAYLNEALNLPTPPFQAMAVVQNAPAPLPIAGFPVTWQMLSNGASLVDITLSVSYGDDGSLGAMYEYKTAMFHNIHLYASQFQALFQKLLTNPDTRVSHTKRG